MHVDDSGHARIADFGLATVTKDLDTAHNTTYDVGVIPRWTAPEVLHGGPCTKAADVFSFGMLMIEVHQNLCNNLVCLGQYYFS